MYSVQDAMTDCYMSVHLTRRWFKYNKKDDDAVKRPYRRKRTRGYDYFTVISGLFGLAGVGGTT